MVAIAAGSLRAVVSRCAPEWTLAGPNDCALIPLFIEFDSGEFGDKRHAMIEVPECGGRKNTLALRGGKEIVEKAIASAIRLRRIAC